MIKNLILTTILFNSQTFLALVKSQFANFYPLLYSLCWIIKRCEKRKSQWKKSSTSRKDTRRVEKNLCWWGRADRKRVDIDENRCVAFLSFLKFYMARRGRSMRRDDNRADKGYGNTQKSNGENWKRICSLRKWRLILILSTNSHANSNDMVRGKKGMKVGSHILMCVCLYGVSRCSSVQNRLRIIHWKKTEKIYETSIRLLSGRHRKSHLILCRALQHDFDTEFSLFCTASAFAYLKHWVE